MKEIDKNNRNTENVAKQERKRSFRLFWKRFSLNELPVMGAVILVIMIGFLILTPFLPLQDPIQVELSDRLKPIFSESHLLGTDQFGRDILSRMLWGGRTSLLAGFAATSIALILGVFMGLISGYYGSYHDMAIMRLTDVVMSFPMIFLAIVIIATLGSGLFNAVIAVGIAGYPIYSRIVRAAVLTVKEQDFVEAVRALGAGNWRTMLLHIFPNITHSIIVAASLDIGNKIILISSLSFLGLGIQPPDPDWGTMIAEGQRFLRVSPKMSTIPGLAIFIVVIAFNLVGDGLRDALDPKSATSKETQI